MKQLERINPADLRLPPRTDPEPEPEQPAEPLCSICEGAGFYKKPLRYWEPGFGELHRCACRVLQQRTLEQLGWIEVVRRAGLEGCERFTFGRYDPDAPGVGEAFARAYEFAQRQENRWLVLFGDTGCGKTHLAIAIAWHMLEGGVETRFAVTPSLLNNLRATFDRASPESFDQRMTEITTVELLVLDDLGTQRMTDWAREQLYTILNERSLRRRTTVITTNQTETEINDRRIYSRLVDRDLSGGIVHIRAGDYRRRGGAS